MDEKIVSEILDITFKAHRAVQNKRPDEALRYFDDAIRLASSAKIATFGLRLHREEMLRTTSRDLAKEIPILEEALSFYRQRKQAEKVVKTYERLVPELAILGRVQETYDFLNQAEEFVSLLVVNDTDSEGVADLSQLERFPVDRVWKIDKLRARVRFIRDNISVYFESVR